MKTFIALYLVMINLITGVSSCVEYNVTDLDGLNICKDLPYKTIIFPNFLKHRSISEAIPYISQFELIVNKSCSEEFESFICQLFLPRCANNSPVPPCASLCETVRNDCIDVMKELGIQWPSYMECGPFPHSHCVSPKVQNEITEKKKKEGTKINKEIDRPKDLKASNITTKVKSKENKINNGCHLDDGDNIASSCQYYNFADGLRICKDLPYTKVMFPNLLKHRNISEAIDHISRFVPLVTARCSEEIQTFLCRLYFPRCVNNSPIPPCKSLCKAVRDGCLSLLNKFGFVWPNEMDCNNFPDRHCVKTKEQRIMKTSNISESSEGMVASKVKSTCVSVVNDVFPNCRNLTYNKSSFNKHANRKFALLAIHARINHLMSMMKRRCSNDLESFLCHAYLPICSHGAALPPCKSYCQKVKTRCIGLVWPKHLSCNRFRESNTVYKCLE